MNEERMLYACKNYLSKLCSEITERPVGSEGNRQATWRFKKIVESFNWMVESTGFQALDWDADGAEFRIGQKGFEVIPSPYSTGFELEVELAAAGSLEQLEKLECSGKILLLFGDLTREQLLPKNFVFYNPEEHQQILSTLERKNPAAIVSATSRNASLAGGVYPFPLIEDGDFDIPSVYMSEEEGKKALLEVGKLAILESRARRVPAIGYNLVARKGKNANRRIAVSAHIDAKKGSPGAIDNASGVVILLLLAELLEGYSGKTMIELIPFNGEDYYAASGQMIYIDQNQDFWRDIKLNINIDGAGYYQGGSVFSLFNLPSDIKKDIDIILEKTEGISEGKQWVQGDHSIFLQQGIPAIAVSSQWFIDHIDSQEITHTAKDHPGIVDCQKLVEIARVLADFILNDLV